MNKKGFTLIELLATLVVLGIVVGLTIVGFNVNIRKTKEETEKVFISTLTDAIKMYLDDDKALADLNFNKIPVDKIDKTLKSDVLVYEADSKISFDDMINRSSYSPLLKEDLKNPANGKQCNYFQQVIHIYKDDDDVYYYCIKRSSFTVEGSTGSCLVNDNGYISNYPKDGFECD